MAQASSLMGGFAGFWFVFVLSFIFFQLYGLGTIAERILNKAFQDKKKVDKQNFKEQADSNERDFRAKTESNKNYYEKRRALQERAFKAKTASDKNDYIEQKDTQKDDFKERMEKDEKDFKEKRSGVFREV
jgi:hypothetical protein